MGKSFEETAEIISFILSQSHKNKLVDEFI